MTPLPHEQTRARYPDESGYAERGGVKLHYEVYGSGEPTILLLPTWSIIHSRHWKMQIPYLARHCRVVTFDGRGNGRSDRPEAGLRRARVRRRRPGGDGCHRNRARGDRVAVARRAAGAAAGGRAPGPGGRSRLHRPLHAARRSFDPPFPWDEELSTGQGWAKWNRHYWLRDYRGFLEFFFSQMFNEPHSTKPIEDCVGWGLETTAETLVATELGGKLGEEETRELCRRIRCPVLVIQGTADAITGQGCGIELAEATGGDLVLLEGAGHGPHVRDPVKVNLLLRDFAAPAPVPPRWARGRARRKRALYICSPIGLGHAQRDVAIAGELRKLHPDLEIDWLAQHPVTHVLAARGERVHPASAHLASESGHIEPRVGRARPARLPGHPPDGRDPARQLHGLPRPGPRGATTTCGSATRPGSSTTTCTRTPSGNAPPTPGSPTSSAGCRWPTAAPREAFLTADYNAEMIEHIARFPRVRDRAIFVGDPDDIVPDAFGPGLPPIRDWTERHYDFAGYVTGFDPRQLRGPAGAGLSRRTSACASSPSAARGSAAICCGG